jgi:hypothetical protein
VSLRGQAAEIVVELAFLDNRGGWGVRSLRTTTSKGPAMRYAEILSRGGRRPLLPDAARAHAAYCPAHRGVSRRRFLQGAAGLTGVAVTLGSSVRLNGAVAGPPGLGLVTPIPATLNLGGEEFHVQAPPFTGVDSDPSSVFDFRGAAGLAFISGECERTNRRTGETRTLPYSFNDMRFMQGVFQGRDGHVRNATFVFT